MNRGVGGAELVAGDGTRRGERIEGSQYFRSFCEKCGEAIRVSELMLLGENYCRDCEESRDGGKNE
ncbi:MAG: hypothetical protein KDA16_11895 [Phycisphaerales bacterium]|nr:hypothetical protein [Phycisphaerales bacterium]